MSVTLPTLNKINLLELEMLKSVIGIDYDPKTQQVILTKPFSTDQLIQVYHELKNTIWNSSNLAAAVSEMEEEKPLNTRIHYYGSGRPEALDSYLSKMGLLDSEILIEDPMSFLLTVKPTYPDHPLKNPQLYVKHVYEHAVSMLYLREWVEKGYLYYIPNLPLIDIDAFWELSQLNETIAATVEFDQLPSIRKSMRYNLAEGSITMMLEFARLTKNNYKIEHIKRIFPQVSDEQAQKYLDIIRNQTLEEREEYVVKWALDKHPLPFKEKLALLSQFERTRPFNIERYLDVSTLNGNLMQHAGMPLLHATYLAERLNCIPSTDNPGVMHGYVGWCEALGQNMGTDFEKVRTKVELPFSFLDSLPLQFIEESREKGKGAKASRYLDEEWGKIRQSPDRDSYLKAARDFSLKVQDDFSQLEKESDTIIDELLLDAGTAGFTGLGSLVTFNLLTELPVAIVGSIATMLGVAYQGIKSKNRNKNQLEAKPLALFLKAKKVRKKKKK